MKPKYKHIIALNLMLLMLSSTIGFSIVSTFCHGCEEEHTRFKVVATDNTTEYHCCASKSDELSCCSITHETHENECEHEHNSKTLFARLDYEATEAKASIVNIDIQTIYLLLIFLNEFVLPQRNSAYSYIIHSDPPPIQGRNILALKCVLRN